MNEESCKTLECGVSNYDMYKCQKVFIDGVECKGAWKILDRIGEKSINAEVYKACDRKDYCNYVFKKIVFKHPSEIANFRNEVRAQNAAGDLAPKIVQVLQSEMTAGIVMNAFSHTMKRLIINVWESNLDQATRDHIIISTIREAYELVHKLHNRGIIHGDTHLDNFMQNDTTKEWVIIDFGNARFAKDNRIGDFNSLFRSVKMLSKALKFPEDLDKLILDIYDEYYNLMVS